MNDKLVVILRELDTDKSVPIYRGAMLAFIRFLQTSLQNQLVQAGWRLRSQHEPASDKDADEFAAYVYAVLWPNVTQADRIRLAKEALQIAKEDEPERP